MHAPFLARLLSIPHVFVPKSPGILSAIGMLMADVIKDYSCTVMRNPHNTSQEELYEIFSDLEKRGIADLLNEGVTEENVSLERYLDMRYEGQSHEIIVPFSTKYVEDFHILHEKTYGYRNQDKTVEMVNLRLRAVGIPDKPRFRKTKKRGKKPPAGALLGQHDVVFDQEPTKTQVISRDKLLRGNIIDGPAILIEYSSTIVIPPFARARVDGYGNLIMVIEV
jgi:N-methylhydantoinase A